MPIFISYSHEDKEFVDRLAVQLIKRKYRIWIDRWELSVGDSILSNIEKAIIEASALMIILSNSSIKSEWCKKELNSGLIRELEEKKVIVLPVLIEDCIIPLFLKDKIYADFRTNFDAGLDTIINSIARITSDNLGRVEQPKFHIDWSIDSGTLDNQFMIKLIMVEHATEQPYSVLSQVYIIANEYATKRYFDYEKCDLDWYERLLIINSLAELDYNNDMQLIIDNNLEKSREICIMDEKSDLMYTVVIKTRRLGDDTGKDIFIDLGSQFKLIRDLLRTRLRDLTKDELEKIFILKKRYNVT